MRGRFSPTVIDALLAAAVAAAVQYDVWFAGEVDERFAQRPLSAVLLLAASASLLVRRRRPLATAAAVAAGVVLQAAATGTFSQSKGLTALVVVTLYSLGAHAPTRSAVAGAVMVGAALALKPVVASPVEADDSPFVALFWWLLTASLTGLGALVRARRRSGDLHRRAAALDAERASHARAAVAEERARIARDLHDVVSHNVSATILQAGAAQQLLRGDPDRAEAALRSIQAMGREALGEMRRMLGVMRAVNGDGPPAPQPRLSDVPAIVERTREAGLPADLEITGAERELAPGVELSAYRIVQEALTNARRHAAARHVTVRLAYGPGDLTVEVADDGRGAAGAGDPGGHGLIGMRERVAFFGGDFEAGPRPDGGFVVRARFPTGAAP